MRNKITYLKAKDYQIDKTYLEAKETYLEAKETYLEEERPTMTYLSGKQRSEGDFS